MLRGLRSRPRPLHRRLRQASRRRLRQHPRINHRLRPQASRRPKSPQDRKSVVQGKRIDTGCGGMRDRTVTGVQTCALPISAIALGIAYIYVGTKVIESNAPRVAQPTAPVASPPSSGVAPAPTATPPNKSSAPTASQPTPEVAA